MIRNIGEEVRSETGVGTNCVGALNGGSVYVVPVACVVLGLHVSAGSGWMQPDQISVFAWYLIGLFYQGTCCILCIFIYDFMIAAFKSLFEF